MSGQEGASLRERVLLWDRFAGGVGLITGTWVWSSSPGRVMRGLSFPLQNVTRYSVYFAGPLFLQVKVEASSSNA